MTTIGETAGTRHGVDDPTDVPGRSADSSRAAWVPRKWDALDAHGLRRAWCAVGAVLTLQLIGLLAYSAYLYDRFDLSGDFATFNQAWSQISQGHSPTDTIQGFAFWQNHFELILWPISLFHSISSSPFFLLVLQDLAIVATELLIVVWVARLCIERLGTIRTAVVLVALAVTASNPWWYETASFDFHPQMLGLPLVVFSAYSLWRGRTRSALIVGVLALLCGDVVTLLVLAVGIAALTSRHAREAGSARASSALILVSAAWFVLITALDANQGSSVSHNYGYLVGAAPGASTWTVYSGLLRHPAHVARVLASRWHPVEKVLTSAGIIGIATPWGFFVSVVTVVPAALNVNPAFVSPLTAFQTLPVVPFVLVGTFMLLVAIGVGRTGRPIGGPVVAWGLAAVLLLVPLVQSSDLFFQLRAAWWYHSPAQAQALNEARQKIGPTGEVIASWDALGRFADREYVYPLLVTPQTFPLRTRTAWIVIVEDHGTGLDPQESAQDVSFLIHKLDARTLVSSNGVWLLKYSAPQGPHSLTLPGPH